MAYPITGPIHREIGGTGTPSYYLYRHGYRQAKPYNLVLDFDSTVSTTSQSDNLGRWNARVFAGDMIGAVPWTDLENAIYDKLKGRISERAEMLTALVEVNKSIKMVADRLVQMTVFVQLLRRGHFLEAARVLKMPGPPKGVSTHKALANNFLEYHYGWVPTIGDIYSAIDVLQQPLKSVWVKASERSGWTPWGDWYTPIFIDNPSAVYPDTTYRYYREQGRYERFIQCGCTVEISNPNLWLANQLGLVNPVATLWATTPYSFVVDWFVNVEQVLSSMTDFYGLTLSNTWMSKKLALSHHAEDTWNSRYFVIDDPETGAGHYVAMSLRNERASTNATALRRRSGLPTPVLAIRPLKAWGLSRGLAAASLLTQRLRS